MDETQQENQARPEPQPQGGEKTPMNKNLMIGVVVLVIVVVGGFLLRGKSQTATTETSPLENLATPTPRVLSVTLNEVSNSKESGEAILEEVDGKTKVTLNLTGAPGGVTQPAHIHKGECPGVGDVVYPLTFPVDGQSETTLEVGLDELTAQLPLAINIHKSASEAKVYVACGQIPNT